MPNAVTETGRGTGAVQDRIDTRDFLWQEIGWGSPVFDWNEGYDIEIKLGAKLPVKDQGASFSCGGMAWSTYASVLEAIATNSIEERSAKFIYSQTFVPPNGGSMGRDNANLFINQGVAHETLTSSYQNGPPTEVFMRQVQDITDASRFDAKNDRSISYASVSIPANIDSIAQALRDNYGVILGIAGQNNGTWTSAFPAPPLKQEWAHWIYAGKAKVINGVKYLGCLNSWGSDTGDKGWQFLSEDYINKTLPNGYGRAVWQVWTHIFNPLSIPPFTHNFKTNIAYKSDGSEVTALQRALQLDGEFPKSVPCTGFYGDITRRAVLDFQLKYSVASLNELFSLNGELVGTKTRMKLNQLFNT